MGLELQADVERLLKPEGRKAENRRKVPIVTRAVPGAGSADRTGAAGFSTRGGIDGV